MKIIEIKRADGGISYMRIVTDVSTVETIAEWQKSSGFVADSWREIQESDIVKRQPPS